MKKKGQLNNLTGFALVLVIFTLIISIGLSLTSKLRDTGKTPYSQSYYFQNETDYVAVDWLAFYQANTNATRTYDFNGVYNLTLTGANYSPDGYISGGLYFSGSNQYFTSAFDGATLGNSFSWAAWIKQMNSSNAGIMADGIWGCAESTNSTGAIEIEADYNGFDLYLETSNGNENIGPQTGFSLADNDWHLITLSFEYGTGATWYEDGIIVNSNPINITGSRVTCNSSLNIRAGTRYGDNALDYKGYLDEYRLYNRTLSSLEVSKLYNASVANYNTTNFNYTETLYHYDDVYNVTAQNISGISSIPTWIPVIIVAMIGGIVLFLVIKQFEK